VKSSFQTRCILLCSILVIGLSVLSGRLVQIQLVDRQRYAESSRKAYHRIETLPAIRGMIVDRREEPLGQEHPGFHRVCGQEPPL
jgi:cell division protein FtsI/penicillin-binding protein 2